MFQFGNAVFLAAAGFLAARYRWSRVARCGFVLFLAGGLSNLTDRIAIGSVIDFLNVGIGPLRTGIFNVADVAIMARSGDGPVGSPALEASGTGVASLGILTPQQCQLFATEYPADTTEHVSVQTPDSTVLASEMH